MRTISKGVLPDGRSVEVREGEGSYWRRFEVLVNGVEVEITGRPDRLRDGGTTTIPTSVGRVHLPRRMRQEPGPDTLDGVVYLPGPTGEERARG